MTAGGSAGTGATPLHHVAYFVHDLGDAAVARRVRMMHAGGLTLTVVGFYRHATPPPMIDGAVTVALGRTADGRLLQRCWSVGRTLVRFGAVAAAVKGCDVVMARNLEMLVLAARARGRRRLVYECLDIHRVLLGSGIAARAIQAVERRLLRRIDLVVTSSRRFVDDYFRARRLTTAPLLLVENKVLVLSGEPVVVGPAPGPPWIIGWFGMLRCPRSLRLLRDLVGASDGRVELVLAGIPAHRDLVDLPTIADALPGMRFLGRYAPTDLPALYGGVHYTWAIDYFEEGLNSAWLMPNRLYEGLAHGAVPIALGEVETGAWLRRHAVGVVIESADELPARVVDLAPADYAALRADVARLPRSAVTMGPAACRALVAAIVDGCLPATAAV